MNYLKHLQFRLIKFSASSRSTVPHAQKGTVLIITLVFLLLTTIVGVTAISTSTNDEKIAGNLRDRNHAFEAAELALRYGEFSLERHFDDLTIEGDLKDEGYYFNSEWTEVATVKIDRASEARGEHDFAIMAEEPIFMVEKMDMKEIDFVYQSELEEKYDINLYKITARGHGVNSPAVSVVQSRYLKMVEK